MAAAVLLAYVPRLPSPHAPTGLGLASGSVRITPGTNRRLRLFATTQIAFSFVLLAGAGMLLATLVALQTASTGYDMRQVLAFDLPTPSLGIRDAQEMDLLPGDDAAHRRAAGRRGRGARQLRAVARRRQPPRLRHLVCRRGLHARERRREPARAAPRRRAPASSPSSASRCSPAATSPPRTARGSELVVIVSQSVAQRLFPNGDAINRKLWWTDPYFGKPRPRRIVGVVADVDDENVVRGPALTIYHPVQQIGFAGRLFVHATGDPYALVPAGDADHPRDVGEPARGARRHARGRARGGARAGTAERLRGFRDSPASPC